MKYVKLLRNGQPVWGVLQDGMVRTLSKPPLRGCVMMGRAFL